VLVRLGGAGCDRGDRSAIAFKLDKPYHRVAADGTVARATDEVSPRNTEGAVLLSARDDSRDRPGRQRISTALSGQARLTWCNGRLDKGFGTAPSNKRLFPKYCGLGCRAIPVTTTGAGG